VTSSRAVHRVAISLVLVLASSLLAVAPATAAHHSHHHSHHGKVVWDSTSFTATAGQVAAHGRVPRGRAKVRLQVKLPGGWHTFATSRSSRSGRFSIAGSLDWYGAHHVRVSTSGRPGFKRSTTVTVLTSYAPRGNPADHAFLTQDGIRYSFDPCRTVRYVVNADDVGPAGVQFAQIAMAQASAATGIRVKYVGTSHQIPFQTKQTRLPGRQNLLIAFADETEMPDFVTRSAAGFGGPLWYRPALDGTRHRVWETVEAGVVFDSTRWLAGSYDWSFFQSARPNWGELMLHEVGHAFGLDHSPATDEIMYWQAGHGVYPDGQFRGLYDAGDLAGLATDGLGQGCFHRVGRFREGARALVPAPQPLP